MPAGRYDMTCEQGTTLRQTLRWLDESDAPVDLTGYTAAMQVRASHKAATTWLDLSSTNGDIVIVPDDGEPPTIDCGGNGPPLIMRGYSGAVKLVNKTGTAQCTIDLNSGRVILDSTVTAGNIKIRGVGTVENNSTGTAVVDTSGLVSASLSQSEKEEIAQALLDLADTVEPGLTVRGSLRLALAALAGKVAGAQGTEVIFRNALADTKNRIVATVDGDGNRTAITLDPD